MAAPSTPVSAALDPRPSGHPVAISLVVALVVAVLGGVLLAVLNPAGNVDHASAHAAMGIPAAVLAAAMVWAWPPARPGKFPRVARWTLLAGLALFALGAFTESIGAFGYDGDERLGLAVFHDIGLIVGLVGMMFVMAGTALSVVVAIAARAGKLQSRWIKVLVGLIVVGIAAFVAGGMIFGY